MKESLENKGKVISSGKDTTILETTVVKYLP